jgi:hypothetical protein
MSFNLFHQDEDEDVDEDEDENEELDFTDSPSMIIDPIDATADAIQRGYQASLFQIVPASIISESRSPMHSHEPVPAQRPASWSPTQPKRVPLSARQQQLQHTKILEAAHSHSPSASSTSSPASSESVVHRCNGRPRPNIAHDKAHVMRSMMVSKIPHIQKFTV